jgi:hypothetical protein
MTLRSAPGSARHVVALDYEIMQDQASALGRLGRALETALAALAEYDRVAPYDRAPNQAADPPSSESCKARTGLVQDASHALWCFMVQRESCGLRDPRPVMRDYRVPAEVQNRMGIFPAAPARRRPAL